MVALGGGMHAGGHAWLRGACVTKVGGMHGKEGGMCGEGGMHGKGGHVW